MLLSDQELEALFAKLKTPTAGRALIRKIRAGGPVRNLQYRMEGVRTRYISRKMGRALLAESRTCEFPAIYIRDNDSATHELWPQPEKFDVPVRGPKGGVSRKQHTPDLFVIEDGEGFVIEEWRERVRLSRIAIEKPGEVYCDDEGRWRDTFWEKYFADLGITYRLRCADELPRVLLSNLHFLEDYSREDAPAVPEEVRQRLIEVMAEEHKVPHLKLVTELGFKADHIFPMVLQGDVYVDLDEVLLRNFDELVIYKSEAAARADAILSRSQATNLPPNALRITVGTKFLYDGKRYEVALLGTTNAHCREIDSGAKALLSVEELEELHRQNMVLPAESQGNGAEVDSDVIFNDSHLAEALERLDWLANPEAAPVSPRTIRRLRRRVRGLTAPQEQLAALTRLGGGNCTPKLPPEAVLLAEEVVSDFHNKAKKPTVFASFNVYVTKCANAGVKPMSRSNFYRWIKDRESIKAREGRRAAYQKAPIPLMIDFKHPVHGVLPHEVCYCDHTVLNIFLKGQIEPNLGKPTITMMVDGALTKARAFWLSYRPASAVSVLMCLRDYVRRNGRLPSMLVLDNGREFHSAALLTFCSLYGIHIRWRRSSRPRDSSVIERMLGAAEAEVIAQLDGNSLALKDPRNVSSTHDPEKHIAWTLPALHGALEHWMFNVYPNRAHPRFGISPTAMEHQLILRAGAREHVAVKFDKTLKLLTAPHAPVSPTRVIDRIRGVFVDGHYYWHDRMAQAKRGETVEVRVELWRARIVYVCFRGDWLIALARDQGELEGRHRPEYELQKREESRARRNAAAKDKESVAHSRQRVELWAPENWDSRIREQLTEMYYLYDRLEMTEVMPEAKNQQGALLVLPMARGTTLELIHAQEQALLEDAPLAVPEADVPSTSARSDSNDLQVHAQDVQPTATSEVVAAEWEVVEPDDSDYF